jgi:hypothetical protein
VALGSSLRGDPGRADPAALGPRPGALLSAPPPQTEVLARRETVVLYVPVAQSRITAILYHRVAGSNALDLEPAGKLLNGGVIDAIERRIVGSSSAGPAYYVDSSTASVDVGAAAGTQVYSPVSGQVIGISPNILDGQARWGSIVTIAPTSNPGLVVAVSQVNAAPGLKVGDTVSARWSGQSPPTLIGTVADLAPALDQALRRYTQDAGNHVHVEVQPNIALAVP